MAQGIRIQTGAIVDATIPHAPSSTRHANGELDPDMHHTRKGKQVLRVEGAHRRGREAGPPLLEEAAFSEEVFLPVTFSEFLRFYDNAAD